LLSVARGTSSNQLPVHCYSPLFFRSSEPDCADATTFPVASETGQNNEQGERVEQVAEVPVVGAEEHLVQTDESSSLNDSSEML